MVKKISLVSVLVITFTNFSIAQDIYMILKKGTFELNGDVIYKKNALTLLKKEDKVLNESALIVLNLDNRFVQLPIRDKAYSFSEVNVLFQQKNKTSKKVSDSKSVSSMLFTEHLVKHGSGTSKGSTSRGINDVETFYAPTDSLIVVEDSVRLQFGNASTYIISNLVVKNMLTNETIYDGKSQTKNSHTLNKLKPGKYSWSYTLSNKAQFLNVFIVADEDFKKSFQNDLVNLELFIKEKEFDKDLRELLLDEFYVSKKVYRL